MVETAVQVKAGLVWSFPLSRSAWFALRHTRKRMVWKICLPYHLAALPHILICHTHFHQTSVVIWIQILNVPSGRIIDVFEEIQFTIECVKLAFSLCWQACNLSIAIILLRYTSPQHCCSSYLWMSIHFILKVYGSSSWTTPFPPSFQHGLRHQTVSFVLTKHIKFHQYFAYTCSSASGDVQNPLAMHRVLDATCLGQVHIPHLLEHARVQTHWQEAVRVLREIGRRGMSSETFGRRCAHQCQLSLAVIWCSSSQQFDQARRVHRGVVGVVFEFCQCSLEPEKQTD